MSILLVSISLIIAYLIGAFPTAIVLGKAKFGIDIRDHGSGNAGATNTFRVLGKKPGILVMAVDIFKGYTATVIPIFLYYFGLDLTVEQFMIIQLAHGMAAVIGHVFPIYAKFKGGKGVASLLGMVIAVNTPVALACLLLFLIVFITWKYVSLGSMVAAIAYPIFIMTPIINPFQPHPIQVGFGIVVAILVVLTHKKNIGRLIKGEEGKANLKLKKSK